MTSALLLRSMALLAAVGFSWPVFSQERIYRCGNEYTNDAVVAKSRSCKLVEGGNVTVVQGTSPQAAAQRPSASASASASPGAARIAPRTGTPEQRSRDSDARQILEAELRKAEERLAQAHSAYANGQPEKEGIESRNHQRYLDRVAELKAAVGRAETDVSGLKRELARLGGGPLAGSSARAPGEAAVK